MLQVSVIIPHAGGREILAECLESLAASEGVNLQTIIVNNGTINDVDEKIVSIVKNVQVLRYECNLGFAGACNRGVEAASADYVFLLNNDAVVAPDTIKKLAERIAGDESIGACQPKIMSYFDRDVFDYSSAAGGEIDVFGYPFARGRIFESIEEDYGQYDSEDEVFWGAGAALMIRRDLYLRAGGLNERFYAHMEEIDLLWRLRLMGNKMMVIPSAVAWHRGAVTIKSGSFKKLFYNHRNSLAMMVLNYSAISLLRYFPLRVFLDVVTMGWALIKRDFVRLAAVFCAMCWLLKSIPYLVKNRNETQMLREVPERKVLQGMFPGSIAYMYFVRKRTTWKQIQQIF